MKIRISLFALLLFAAGWLTGCTNAENDRMKADADNAWNDFKASAERAENEAKQEWREAKYDVNEETGEWRDNYDRNVARADSFSTHWDENRRREYDQYKERYRTAHETRQANYTRQQRIRKMNSELTGGTDIGTMTAANARQMYENFVNKVDAQKSGYNKEDWEEVERISERLDTQYDQTKGISNKDKLAITKLKNKYRAYKAAAKVDRNT